MAIDAVGKQAIIEEYNRYPEHTHYAVFEAPGGKVSTLKYQYDGDDRAEGLRRLQSKIDAWMQSSAQGLMALRFYRDLTEERKLDAKTPYAGSFQFKVTDQVYGPSAAADSSFLTYLQAEIESLKIENASLREEIEELKADLEDAENELEQAAAKPNADISKLGIIGTIGQAGEQYPWMQDMFKKIADPLADLFTGVKYKAKQQFQSNTMPHQNIAGISPENATGVISSSIDTMANWYAENCGGQQKGILQMAEDFQMLAELTKDSDMMNLALKKLRQLS